MKKVAIIIVNYNGRGYLDDCLTSLFNLDYAKENYRIFLLDNASADDSLVFVRKNFPGVEIIESTENLGFAEGNNIVMRRALAENFDYVCLINQDTISEPDFLSKLIEVAESDEKIAALQPRLMLYPEKDKVNSLGNSIHYLGFGFSSGGYHKFKGDLTPKEIAYASGAAVLIKCEVLKKIGLFDPDFFMYHEDLDLGWRFRIAGYKSLVVPAAVVYHKYEFSKSIKKYYYMERNRFICLLENYKWATIFLITPACLLLELGLLLFSIKSGFFGEKLKVYAYFLKWKNWQKIFKHRQAKNKYRKNTDREVSRVFTGKIEFQEIDNKILKYIVNPIFNAYWQIIKILLIW